MQVSEWGALWGMCAHMYAYTKLQWLGQGALWCMQKRTQDKNTHMQARIHVHNACIRK